MSVQREDTEPDENRAQTSDYRHDPNFRFPERIPWSQLGPSFTEYWGYDESGKFDPEHLEIVGPTGSGKTYLMCTMLQDKIKASGGNTSGGQPDDRSGGGKHRKIGAVIICTKPADGTILKLGWPIVDSLGEASDKKLRAFVFWPRTSRMGQARREYHNAKITGLLHELWRPNANMIVAFDEVGYVESLSGEMKALVQQYWREGRSQGITVTAMKQRPQGALRDMHSETYWTVAFKPKDRADGERFSELFGAKRDWMPVIDSLSLRDREFVIRHTRTQESYISWVDTPLQPQKVQRKAPAWWRG